MPSRISPGSTGTSLIVPSPLDLVRPAACWVEITVRLPPEGLPLALAVAEVAAGAGLLGAAVVAAAVGVGAGAASVPGPASGSQAVRASAATRVPAARRVRAVRGPMLGTVSPGWVEGSGCSARRPPTLVAPGARPPGLVLPTTASEPDGDKVTGRRPPGTPRRAPGDPVPAAASTVGQAPIRRSRSSLATWPVA